MSEGVVQVWPWASNNIQDTMGKLNKSSKRLKGLTNDVEEEKGKKRKGREDKKQ